MCVRERERGRERMCVSVSEHPRVSLLHGPHLVCVVCFRVKSMVQAFRVQRSERV